MTAKYDVAVIGAGVAGMTAAKAVAESGLRGMIVEGMLFGGLVTNINHLEPRPEGMAASGADLSAEMMTEIADLGIEIVSASLTALTRLPSGDLKIETSDGEHVVRSVIVASGARFRKLGIPGEEEFEHRGVSSCADCDGPLYRGQPAVVVGGGDSALQEAAVLTEFCPTVHLVHRGDAFSGRRAFIDAVIKDPKISIHFNSVVDAIAGTDDVDAITLRDLKSNHTSSVPCKAFFAFVGLEANTEFLPPEMELVDGCLKVGDDLQTTLPNVFAAGAVRAGYNGEISNAIDDGRRAAEAAHRCLRPS